MKQRKADRSRRAEAAPAETSKEELESATKSLKFGAVLEGLRGKWMGS